MLTKIFLPKPFVDLRKSNLHNSGMTSIQLRILFEKITLGSQLKLNMLDLSYKNDLSEIPSDVVRKAVNKLGKIGLTLLPEKV